MVSQREDGAKGSHQVPHTCGVDKPRSGRVHSGTMFRAKTGGTKASLLMKIPRFFPQDYLNQYLKKKNNFI